MKMKQFMALNLLAISLLCSCPSASHIEYPPVVSGLNETGLLTEIYPLNPGNTWNYSLEQFQNDVPNTKFKEMSVSVIKNDLNGSNGNALIQRLYPGSALQPNQTLATIYPDHIDLSGISNNLSLSPLGRKIRREKILLPSSGYRCKLVNHGKEGFSRGALNN
jgi:hypothetical protein